MPKLAPVSRRKLVKRLHELGFEGPFAGGKHPQIFPFGEHAAGGDARGGCRSGGRGRASYRSKRRKRRTEDGGGRRDGGADAGGRILRVGQGPVWLRAVRGGEPGADCIRAHYAPLFCQKTCANRGPSPRADLDDKRPLPVGQPHWAYECKLAFRTRARKAPNCSGSQRRPRGQREFLEKRPFAPMPSRRPARMFKWSFF